MKIFNFLLLFLVGCALPTYITKHDLKIFDETTINTPKTTEVDAVINYTIRYLGGAKKLKNTKVMLVNKWIQVPHYKDNGYDLADGHTDIWRKEIIVSVFQTCLADSSLLHELAHVIHDHDSQVPDWWHDDKEFWKRIKELEKKIVDDLCPEGYTHQEIGPDYVPQKD